VHRWLKLLVVRGMPQGVIQSGQAGATVTVQQLLRIDARELVY
jgi:hypothetical protein